MSAFDRFYRNVITECLGFFGSKFINEKRKSHSENSIRLFLGQAKRGELKHTNQGILQVGRTILQHFYLQRKTSESTEFINKFFLQYNSQSEDTRMFSTQLGYILGNKLYYALKKGRFSLKRVQDYFRDPFDEPAKAFNCYLELSNSVKRVKHVSRL